MEVLYERAALTREEVMAKHSLSVKQFSKIADDLKSMKLLDILFHYPSGPYHDIAMHLMAYSL